jgi:hypothetical protein
LAAPGFPSPEPWSACSFEFSALLALARFGRRRPLSGSFAFKVYAQASMSGLVTCVDGVFALTGAGHAYLAEGCAGFTII